MHPFAFLLPLIIFLHFCIVGKAFMIAVRFPGPSLRSWLISPTLGFSFQILIVSIINQAGYPVEKFGRWEAIAISTLAIGILAWKRPSFNLRLLAPFIGASLIVLVYAGWPLFKLGLGWLSYCNDDMANYCLAAMRSLHHGFFDVPTVRELTGGDYSQCYWFLHVAAFIRYGSELLLAGITATSGLNALKIFMPTIVALGMSVPLATAALMRASHVKYKAMVFGAGLLALSPLFLVGIFYQLIAQMAGMALLCSVAALLMPEKISWDKKSALIRYGVVLGILGAALCITYPEITPFCGLGFFLWIVIKSIRERKFFWRPIVGALFVGLIAVVCLRYNIFTYLLTLQEQLYAGSHLVESDLLFPYFLVPSGLPALFGFSALADQFENIIRGYFYFFLAVVCLFLFIILVAKSLKAGQSAACIAAIMIGMGGVLFCKQAGFGTFKLAMFVQPFIAVELALFFSSLTFLPCFIGLGIYCALQLSAGAFYGMSSLGKTNARYVSIPQISESDFEIEKINGTTLFSLRSSHVVIEKIVACVLDLHHQNKQLLEINVPFENIMSVPSLSSAEQLIKKQHPYANNIFLAKDLFNRYNFMFHQQKILGANIVQQLNQHSGTREQELRPLVGIEPLNQLSSRTNKEKKKHFFQQQPLLANNIYLTFIASNIGKHFYNFQHLKTISLYQKEKDPFLPAQSIAAIGRYFLFRVDPSSLPIYLRVAVTKSILGEDRTTLFKQAIAKGSKDVLIDFEGNGAANCYVGPLTPVNVEGVNYVALDFGEEGKMLSKSTKGIMGFYGKDCPTDPRYLVGYARDISAISEKQYKTMDRPRVVSNFPKDLVKATTLEFSGWYEDGWISQNSFMILGPAREGDHLVIKGSIPGIGKILSQGQKLTVTLNGGKMCDQKELPPGKFELDFKIPNLDKKFTRINLTFALSEKLLPPDFRPVAAKIDYAGIKSSEEKVAQ